MTKKKIDLKSLDPRKRAAVLFYQKHKKRLLAYANAYYDNHKEEVLAKAKVRYAKKRRDYFCCVCGKQLPRTLSGHHLYCEVCGPKFKKRNQKKTTAKIKAAPAGAQKPAHKN